VADELKLVTAAEIIRCFSGPPSEWGVTPEEIHAGSERAIAAAQQIDVILQNGNKALFGG